MSEGCLLVAGALAGLAISGVQQGSLSRYDPGGLTFTRDGFPWPTDTELFHATTGLQSIQRQGFRVRRSGLASATGGGTDAAVSLTLHPYVADSIAIGLDVIRRGVTRQMTLYELRSIATTELPLALQDTLESFEREGTTEQELDRWDQGWVLVRGGMAEVCPPDAKPEGYSWTGGGELTGVTLCNRYWRKVNRLDRTNKLEKNASDRWHEGRLFYTFYQRLLCFGEAHGECYNPLFFGTDLDALKRVDPEDIGVLSVRSRVPRICVDGFGALQLGYLKREEALRNEEWLRTVADNCRCDLEPRRLRRTRFSRPRAARSFGNNYRVPETLGPWRVVDSGTRTGRRAMTYLPSMAELRVFDPSWIEVGPGMPVSEIYEIWQHSGGSRWISVPRVRGLDGPNGFGMISLPGAKALKQAQAQVQRTSIVRQGHVFATTHPKWSWVWVVKDNKIWPIPDENQPFKTRRTRGDNASIIGLRGLVIDRHRMTVHGLRWMSPAIKDGQSYRGFVSIGGKKVRAVASTQQFARPEWMNKKHMVSVSVLSLVDPRKRPTTEQKKR